MSSNIVPIANTLLHPPLGALRRELITGVYSGSGDLTRPGGFPPFENVNAYGLTWSFFTVPETFGYQLGSPRRYYERMIQLSTIHTDLAGHELVSEDFEAVADGIYWLWSNAGPTRVHYEIIPAVTVLFEWVVFFGP